MLGNNRIKLDMTMRDAMVALAEGNPGAITAMVEIVKIAEEVDPDAAMGGLMPLLLLDSFEIYGPHIWLLYKDICGHEVPKVIALLRSVQMGLIDQSELKNGILHAGGYERDVTKGLYPNRVDQIVEAVRAKLPKFWQVQA